MARTMLCTLCAALLSVAIFFQSLANASNIDPENDGSKYVWGENVGWINLAPSGDTGVTVTDTILSGYAWGENIGWINFSPIYGGVINDGSGKLGGFAWGQNTGWINFSPLGGGVSISTSGIFVGWAWGENTGWINFRSSGSVSFQVKSLWQAPANGLCGGSNGKILPVLPTSDLCSVGAPSIVIGTGPWIWSCTGSGGKGAVACFANYGYTKPAMVGEALYDTLTAAYNDAYAGVIRAREYVFPEDLTLDLAKEVIIMGGYDTDYTNQPGWTSLHGILTIKRGSLVADRLSIW